MRPTRLVVLALAALATLASACHADPNTGLPRAGVQLPWRSYPKCQRVIDILAGDATMRPKRVISEVFVTCTHYVPDECDDALRARACELGGDAVIVSETDLASTLTPSGRAVKRGRSGRVVVWDDRK